MTTFLDGLDALYIVGVPLLLVPLAVWTLMHLPVQALLRSRAFAHPDARYFGHLAWLSSLPICVAVAVCIYTTGVHPPQVTLALLPLVEGTPSAAVTAAPAAAALTLRHLVGGLILLAGFVAFVRSVRLFVRWRTARALRADGATAPEWLVDLAVAWQQRLGIRRDIRVLVAPGEAVPMTIGLHRPIVVMPEALLHDQPALTLALTHEMIHVARFDDAVHAFECAVDALFGWHPAVRRLCRDLSGYRELACDTAVLAFHRDRVRTYADLLLRFATRSTRLVPTAVSISDSPNTLKNRIQAMKTPASTSPRLRRVGLVLGVLLLGVAGFVVACTDVVGPQNEVADLQNETANAPVPSTEQDVFIVVEVPPKLIGGLEAVTQKIQYPSIAKRAGVEGRVTIQFIVDKQGNVQDAEVLRGIGAGCDEEALRVVRSMEFEPGHQGGKAVNVKMSLPVTFRLS
jgi:TonB family protein